MKVEEAASARYARALFEAAKKAGALDKVHEDLRELVGVFIQSGLKKYLENPRFSFESKRRVVLKVAEKLRSPLSAGFLLVLLKKLRISHLFSVARAYEALLYEHKNIVIADVTLAGKPNAAFDDAIRHSLEKITRKKVIVSYKTNPDIIGGIFIKMGDRVIDASVSSKLKDLRKQLLETRLN